ncbi:callose synthase 7-like [Vicia villosa]|uniref:callose synthase 7-like n=1 Tax=Vicia villosa TaxID=3911 RepID=UPI00273B7985|nr:callose synthase 7-like [Vicia villosa]
MGSTSEENIMDGEIVPSSLAVVVPILRAAIDIEVENPRVAYLCRWYAVEKAHTIDPTSSGHGVRQFKTNLLRKLEREEEITQKHTNRTDVRELLSYYQTFYETRIRDGEFTKEPEEMVTNVQIATVLYEVLKTILAHRTIDEKTKKYAADVENKKGQYEHYICSSSCSDDKLRGPGSYQSDDVVPDESPLVACISEPSEEKIDNALKELSKSQG